MRISDWSSDVCSSVLGLLQEWYWGELSVIPIKRAMHLQAVIDAWVRSSVWQYRKVLPHYPTIRRCPLRASCFAFLAQRVRGLRRVRDGLKVEREALGVRHGDYRHGYRRSEDRAQHRARHPLQQAPPVPDQRPAREGRSEEHTSELQSLMRISYAVFCLKKKKKQPKHT